MIESVPANPLLFSNAEHCDVPVVPSFQVTCVLTCLLLCPARNVSTASATVSPPAPSAAAPAQESEAPVLPFRVGYGFDLHRLVEGKKLIICGVDVPHVRGCDAHSDGMASAAQCSGSGDRWYLASITPCTVHDGYLSLVSNVISIIANNVVFKI